MPVCLIRCLLLKNICRLALEWKELDDRRILPFLGIIAKYYPHNICLVSPWMPNRTIMRYLKDKNMQDAHVDLLVSKTHFYYSYV
jgi:hypothetical protein